MDSPSKISAPRKQRNQASSNDHIEFAAEITTSLLGQVRHLQAVLSDRDETLKTVTADKARLETDAEGFAQRLKHLDDSEQRYKDENWNLETQLQDLTAQFREGSSREQKLQQSLAAVTSERTLYERELEELKQTHGRAAEDHAALRKQHDMEMTTLRKELDQGENEKSTLQRRLEDLASQNQELARGIASKYKDEELEPEADAGKQAEEYPFDLSGSEHSPPPSPTKGSQRHSMLETETLRSSLHHAHKMIQNLKNNVHREKSEKSDLKRMLQEARDELEIRRVEPSEKRMKSRSQVDMQRVGRPGLGRARSSRTDVLMDDPSQDPEWEDHEGNTPIRKHDPDMEASTNGVRSARAPDASDGDMTANDTEDAFETANERDSTDTDAFQTGAESMAGVSSDELTETETAVNREGTVKDRRGRPAISTKPGDRRSIQSTASTSEDEQTIHTPIQGQPQRFRLRMNRRSRVASGAPGSSAPSSTRDSPASFINVGGEGGQSLAAELESMDDDDVDDTPSKDSIRSHRSRSREMSNKQSSGSLRRAAGSQPSTPGLRPSTMIYSSQTPPVPRIPMVDSGMMTEPLEAANERGVSPPMSNSAIAITDRIFGGTSDTPSTKAPASRPGSRMVSDSTATSTPPRPVWDQPLNMFSGVIPGFNQSANTTPMSAKSNLSKSQDSPVESASDHGRKSTDSVVYDPAMQEPQAPTSPPLALSPIKVIETTPSQPVVTDAEGGRSEPAKASDSPTNVATAAATGGILGSVFGWNRKSRASSMTSQRTTDSSLPIHSNERAPLGEIAPNSMPEDVSTMERRRSIYDQGVQTVLSSEELDQMISNKGIATPEAQRAPLAGGVMRPAFDVDNDGTPKAKAPDVRVPEMSSFRDSTGKNIRRPTSAASSRSRTSQYPPLPPDHQEAIAAASSKTPSKAQEIMGPPIAPASAYSRNLRSRANSRPQTPSQQGYPSPSSKGGTTPRANRYSARSRVSRRSSLSSFESDLDERFNIRSDGMPMPQGVAPGTDPRMIQAITQTMIGEMMWKYTRKAGRGEMSNTRHRRFFWVHPYTRTLYWSDRDPASANRAELKSKSVAIEAVRVVTDDNPNPPGLHRKSIIIVTPGRSVQFTAQTSQRHETWFNALSYLLLRTGPDGQPTNDTDGGLTDADVEEFNPGYRRSARSRVSLASFRSQGTNNRTLRSSLASRTATQPNQPNQPNQLNLESEDGRPERRRESLRHRISRSLSRSRGSRAPPAKQNISGPIPHQAAESSSGATPHASISSRMSGYWKQTPSVRNSMRSRSSVRNEDEAPPPTEPGVLEGGRSVLAPSGGDSAEDLRRVIEARENQGGLENVRACCDGTFSLTLKKQMDACLVAEFADDFGYFYR